MPPLGGPAPFEDSRRSLRFCGDHWSNQRVNEPVVIRDDLSSDDIGYPTSLRRDDGRIYTVYYGQDDHGVTCIMASTFELSEQ